MAFNPDPAASMFNTYFGSMPCANTAAADEKTRTDRDATAEELAELDMRVAKLAQEIAGEKYFATDVIADIEDSWFESVGMLSIFKADDLSLQAVVGEKIVVAVRDRAIAAAKKELGA